MTRVRLMQQDQASRSNNSTSGYESSQASLSASASTLALPKSIPRQSHSSTTATNSPMSPALHNTRPTQQQQQSYINNYDLPQPNSFTDTGLARPPSMGSPNGRAYSNNVSSTHRSSRNLSPGVDANYNLTQSDLTLDGLSQRWHAYQAMMRKYYAEAPFYRRWTKSKWILLFSTFLLLAYSVAVFVFSLGYLLKMSLVASVCGIVCALVGLVGTFREDRVWLSWYTTLLWPVFALYVSIGYITFRRTKEKLHDRLRAEWTYTYSRDQRLTIQRNLKCCGYLNSNNFGEYDPRCFPMINLPGCVYKYHRFELKLLDICWTAAFSIVPFHLFVMISALLCSNHVDGMLRSARPGLKSFKEEKEE
ncbi:hypothetical protein BG011_003868 [Mortierella polycephala]|uniref:Tetraspanin Tsp2 n=1 Tax=Mortierella polycephala TaxID=41804 RepID=A0A9P6Q208_9FUNG|nr:hypothetical protein BG011_003868 [Mortierella polycephala]